MPRSLGKRIRRRMNGYKLYAIFIIGGAGEPLRLFDKPFVQKAVREINYTLINFVLTEE